MTGAIVGVDIMGKDGLTLKDKWAHGPITYLGLMMAGFPNLFMITGPGSPSVLSNMAVSIEQHVDWIADRLATSATEARPIEPTETAEAGWVRHVNDCADITLFPPANSWYMGANVPGKPRVFLPYVGGVDVYRGVRRGRGRATRLRAARPGGHPPQRRRHQPPAARRGDGARADGRSRPAAARVDVARRGPGLLRRAAAMRPPGPEVGEIVDGTLPGPAGDLDYRLYRPATPGPHPIVVYFHGGGWVLGSETSDDPFCRDLCVRDGRGHRLRQLPPRAGGPVPGRGRGRVRRGALDRRPRRRARWRPRPAGGGRLERRRQPRRRRHPAGPRRRRPGVRRPAARDAGDRCDRPAVVPGQRRRATS